MGPMMKCGHAAQGTMQADGAPVCVICFGITRDAEIVDDAPPSLEGRLMRCSYMRGKNGRPCAARTNPVPSSATAAFFSHKPSEEYDTFYCGCWGWD